MKSRLGELAGVFHPDAISLSARQVAAYSGDVRQALLICSRAAERRRTLLVADLDARVRTAALKTSATVHRSSSSSSNFSTGGGAPGVISPLVAIEDVVGARAELNDSAHMRALRSCTFGEALLLVALGAELRVSGREEVKFQAVVDKVGMLLLLLLSVGVGVVFILTSFVDINSSSILEACVLTLSDTCRCANFACLRRNW